MLERKKRFQKLLELSQTRQEVQHSKESAFMPVGSQSKCPRVLFEQDSQPQNPMQDPFRFLLGSRGDLMLQSRHCLIPIQECPSQGIRNQVEMDALIPHRLKSE